MKTLSALVWVALAFLPAVLFFEYINRLVRIEMYQYVPVLVLAVSLLFWVEWDWQTRLPNNWLNIGLILLGTAFAVFGAWIGSPWLGCVAALALLAAFLNSQQSVEKTSGQRLWPLIIPSLLMLRAPFQMDNQLSSALQVATSAFSSFILDSFGVIHRLAGNVFFLEGDRYLSKMLAVEHNQFSHFCLWRA